LNRLFTAATEAAASKVPRARQPSALRTNFAIEIRLFIRISHHVMPFDAHALESAPQLFTKDSSTRGQGALL
jgi:hypothetical protein